MKLIKVFLLLLFVQSCGTIPPVDFTVQDVGMVSNRKDIELKSLTVGFAPKAQQKVIQMYPGPDFASLWKEALQDSINRSLIFKDDQNTKINLSVRITELDTPEFGTSMTTRTSAIYEIIDRSNGDLLFTQEITSEGIVPFEHAFIGAVRAIESINRSVRNNIADFINIVEQTDLSNPVFKGE